MNQVSVRLSEWLGGLSSINLRLFFSLSRTPHGLLDMCTPAMAAMLWLGSFPPVSVVSRWADYSIRRLYRRICA